MLELPRQGGSNEYPQSMFWSKRKKNMYTLHTPVLLYIKIGFRGVFIARTFFSDEGLGGSFPKNHVEWSHFDKYSLMGLKILIKSFFG